MRFISKSLREIGFCKKYSILGGYRLMLMRKYDAVETTHFFLETSQIIPFLKKLFDTTYGFLKLIITKLYM